MRFIYITNKPEQALACENAGVDTVMVDLELHGKVKRQGHLNTVISRHSYSDISRIRKTIKNTELLVRVNPIHCGSSREIDECIDRGAQKLMLPMFRHQSEVFEFVELIDGRVPVSILLETGSAVARINRILEADGISDVHIGLNDLHLGLELDFMFEVLSGGIVEYLSKKLRKRDVNFGIGGVARLGQGLLPAELILSEHVRLGSSQVILSRDFGSIFEDNPETKYATEELKQEIAKIRSHILHVTKCSLSEMEINRQQLVSLVESIVESKLK